MQDSSSIDIRATLAVSQEEARLGSSRVINLPGGRSATVTVPAGIRDGEEIRLPGQGVTSADGGIVGDLILRVAVIVVDRFTNKANDDFATQTMQPSSPFLSPTTPPSSAQAAGGVNYPTPPLAESPSALIPTEAVDSPHWPQQPLYLQTPASPQASPGAYVPPEYPMYGQFAQQGQIFTPQHLPDTPPQYAPQSQRPRRRGGATVLISLLVLLLLLGSGLFFYLGYYQPNQQNIAGTATAQAQTTGTANAQATSAAQSTANAQATVRAYQTLYTHATQGTPVLNDPLNNQTSNQWDTNSSTNGSCAFSSGAYHSSAPNTGFFQACYAESTNFSNFAFQIDMSIVQGDYGGIIFRADNVNDRFYLFRIDGSGSYDLYLYTSNKGSQAQPLIKNGTTTLMKAGSQPNEITLVAQGGNFTFYLNQQYLNSTADSTYSAGMLGVFAESTSNPTNVAFSNAKVWTF